jgi:MFS family permease
MGIRQMSQPLGVTVAALTIPSLAQNSIAAAVLLSLALTAVLAVASALVIVNPPRPPRSEARETTNPYRGSGWLWRIHAVSALLVVPQFTLSTFGLVWMTVALGVAAPVAGLVVGVSQFVGAIGRILVGQLSDRVGSRVRPLRWVAIAGVLAMGLLAALGDGPVIAACALFVVATTISVADNGLAFTSVAEVAGPFWSGRALGAQNTGQFLAASTVGPAIGALITVAGYPIAFLVSAACAAVATPLIPSRADEVAHGR